MIHSYVQQLRRIKHPRSSVPGPLAGPGEGGRICQFPLFGLVIDTRRGPFETYTDLTNFFNRRLALSRRYRSNFPDNFSTFDNSQSLVFCHQNLNSNNFIVGDDGQLWLVDWPYAGLYPPCFEFVAMRIFADYEEKCPHWNILVPFVCGWYFKQERWLDRIALSLSWI